MATVSPDKGAFNALAAKVSKLHACLSRKQPSPLVMHQMAELLRVRKVIFKGMPADGLVTKLKDGFGVYLNPRGWSTMSLGDKFNHEGGNTWLPNPIRFAIAHELAHIIVDDYTHGDLRMLRRPGCPKHADIDVLEVTCNKLAREILLPRCDLEEAIRTYPERGAPIDVHCLSNSFRVSEEVLLNHLKTCRKLILNRGWAGAAYLVESLKSGIWRLVADYQTPVAPSISLRPENNQGGGQFLGITLQEISGDIARFYIQEGSLTTRLVVNRIWTRKNVTRFLLTCSESKS